MELDGESSGAALPDLRPSSRCAGQGDEPVPADTAVSRNVFLRLEDPVEQPDGDDY